MDKWTAVPHRSGWWEVVDENGRTVDQSGDGGFEEDRAHLVSAAPDLLAALESLMDSLGAMTNRHELHGYMSDDDAAAVYAALDKAKGVKP